MIILYILIYTLSRCVMPSNNCSVADPECLSQILDPNFYYPASRIRIPDLGSRISDPASRIQNQQQKRGVKKKILSYLFCSHKFHKIENYFIFEMLKKNCWANFQRIIELFTQNIVTKLSKIWVCDPGSGGIRKKPTLDPGSRKIPNPRVKKAPDLGSRIPDPDPQHCK